MARAWTEDVVDDDGVHIAVRVKRSCDSCGELIGDATDDELERCVTGLPLLSVAAEHGCQI